MHACIAFGVCSTVFSLAKINNKKFYFYLHADTSRNTQGPAIAISVVLLLLILLASALILFVYFIRRRLVSFLD